MTTKNSVICSCCQSTIEFDHVAQLAQDEDLGFVCKECKNNLRFVSAIMKVMGFRPCCERTK